MFLHEGHCHFVALVPAHPFLFMQADDAHNNHLGVPTNQQQRHV